MLSAIRVAVEHQNKRDFDKQGYNILILNYETRRLNIKYFKPFESDKANAVLERVSSYQSLRSAYPNYFSDIGEFVDIVKSYLK